jgi:hypothetical protein
MALSISFGRSGGIAGLTLTTSVDADQLDAEPASIATKLWLGDIPTSAAGESTGAGAAGGFGGADMFSYQLELGDGRRSQRFEWPDGSVPDDVRPLLSVLTRRAVADG